VAVYAPLLKTAAVELQVTGDSGIIVEADRSFLLQALLHVVENAVLEAGKMSTYRWVEVQITASPPRMIVRDSGPGVLPSRRELIFDPFFTTREGADGLGLFFARTLMRSAGHDLVLSSEGDQFCFDFATAAS
jgi:signal transduction histidine kinase